LCSCIHVVCHTNFPLIWFKPQFSEVLPTFLSVEGCGYLAEGLRFDCGQDGPFAVFALRGIFAVPCGGRSAVNRGLNGISGKVVSSSLRAQYLWIMLFQIQHSQCCICTCSQCATC